jgi:hypothetical protein
MQVSESNPQLKIPFWMVNPTPAKKHRIRLLRELGVPNIMPLVQALPHCPVSF